MRRVLCDVAQPEVIAYAGTVRDRRLAGDLRVLPSVGRWSVGPVGIFSDCSTRELGRIARAGDVVEVDDGRFLQEGSRLRWVYAVLDGSLALTVADRSFIAVRGGVVGARSAITGDAPDADIVAMTRASVYVTTAREFVGLFRELRGLSEGLARAFAHEPGLP